MKQDGEFWEKINSGLLKVNNKAANLRRDFANTSDENKKKDLVPKIIKAEKKEPSPVPSLKKFEDDLTKFTSIERRILNDTLVEKEFTGYDSYLLKEFLLANNHHSNYEIPDKLDQKLNSLQNEEIFLLENNPKKLGGGKFHTVYMAKVMQEGGVKDVIWKSIATNEKVDQGMLSTANLSGIERIEGSAALAERSILTKILDSLLFPSNSVCSETKPANLQPDASGRSASGIIMSLAKGQAVALKAVVFNLSKDSLDENNKDSFKKLSRYVSNIIDQEQFLNLARTDIKQFAKQYPNLQFSKKKNMLKIFDTKMEFKDEKVLEKALEGTIRLGILDYISGQTDRHYENYFIDTDGNITAIDNDMSFGYKAAARKQKHFLVPNRGSLLLDLPKVITSKIRNELKIFFSGPNSPADQFVELVNKRFPKGKEGKGILKRINEVKKLVLDESGATVLNEESKFWDNEELENGVALKDIDVETNYLARDLLVKKSKVPGIINKVGWNAFRAKRPNQHMVVKKFDNGILKISGQNNK